MKSTDTPEGTKHTPEWQWVLNEASRTVILQSVASGRDTVMDFVRYGTRFAQPRFNVNGIMIPASELGVVVDGREHHKEWFKFINHPTAALIASAPTLQKRVQELEAEIEVTAINFARFVEKHGGKHPDKGYDELYASFTAALKPSEK